MSYRCISISFIANLKNIVLCIATKGLIVLKLGHIDGFHMYPPSLAFISSYRLDLHIKYLIFLRLNI